MIRLAALFVCTVLGAGFATGQEIMRYFTDYGIVGLLGVLVSSAVLDYAYTKQNTITILVKYLTICLFVPKW